MPLAKLQFKPGINRDVTPYSNEGGWRDCDKVRFRFGFPEKIGGWEKYTSSTYLGSARALHNWIALDGSNYLGIGTHLKYYIEEGTTLNDITPIRSITAAGDVTFSATTGSTTVTVSDTLHGANQFDFVTFSGSTSLGGNITDTVLDQEYQIQRVIDANTYEITTSVAATASDTGSGGPNTVGTYQINVGLDTTVGGTGWGAGLWGGRTNSALQTTLNEGAPLSDTDTDITVTSASGISASDVILINSELILVGAVSSNTLTGCTRGYSGTAADTHADGSDVYLAVGNANSDDDFTGWGDAAAGGVSVTNQIRLWSHDNFGEDLLINPRDDQIYYWDKSDTLSQRAIPLNTETGTKRSIPTKCKQIIVSDRDRHIIAFGADGIGASSSDVDGDGVQDPLLIRFSSQEDFLDWWPESTNTAGDLRLGSGSTFVSAIETKREILVWTDASLSSLRFIGAPYTFGLTELATNITIMGPNSVIATEDFVFWMGIDTFYIYAGQTQTLPCLVKSKVFSDFNLDQRDKVFGAVNSEFGEVTWFYPSANSSDNDRYVTYNFVEKVWTFGSLSRTAWLDRGTRLYPIAVNGGYIYNHEIGCDDDGNAMDAFIESSPMDMGDGDKFTYIRRILPDLTFNGSTGASPQATFTLKAKNYPGANFGNTDTGSATRTATSPVEQFTNQLDLRVRGRSFAIRVESSALGSSWKLGTPRVDMRQDGRR